MATVVVFVLVDDTTIRELLVVLQLRMRFFPRELDVEVAIDKLRDVNEVGKNSTLFFGICVGVMIFRNA